MCLRHVFLSCALVIAAFLYPSLTTATPAFPGATWETKTPEELGLDSSMLDQFASNVGGIGCIVKDGYMVKTWGTQSSKGDWASAAKPVISTMLFFAINEGLLPGVDALVNPVAEDLYGVSLLPKDQNMSFRHLANMMSAYALPEDPGTHWGYNDYAIQLYAETLFDGVFQQSANAAATAANRLGQLQFEDGSIFSSRGGYGIHTSPRDFARIGWLWLNKGYWNSTQILPQSFFTNYLKPDVPNNAPRTVGGINDYLNIGTYGGGSNQEDDGPGIYGFNWWFNTEVGTTGNITWPDAPPDIFQAIGHGDKEIVSVIPSLGIVASARGNWGSFDPGNPNAGMNLNLKLLSEAVTDGPLPGQIMVDPTNPSWFVYNKDDNVDGKLDPYFLSGAGDPEDFLYRGTRNADGTRNGDQQTLITDLIGTNTNGIYMQALRSHGGDGDNTHNPFIDSNKNNALDDDILDQWEEWFTLMESNDITIYFFFYDDNIKISQSSSLNWPLDGSNNLHPQERYYIETLVNRFEHHKNIIWVVMEEVQEMGSDYVIHAKKIAEAIREADNHNHPIAVHKLNGLSFTEFADDPNLDQFSIQYNFQSAEGLHDGMLTAWNSANGQYNLAMTESNGHYSANAAETRKKSWATAMGGAYVMVFEMDIANTPQSHLIDAGRLRTFMESTNFNEMAPHDELAFGGTEYVLALPGSSYIAYASNLSGNIGLQNLIAGTYRFKWFDIPNGITVIEPEVEVTTSNSSWIKPPNIGNELAVFIERTSGVPGNIPPIANPQSVTVSHNTATSITLTYSDPDGGPGPYSFSISQQPQFGTLTGSGANRTYTPNTGYSGNDSFSFIVNDGEDPSTPAIVSINVQPAGNVPPVAQDQSLATSEGTPASISLLYTDSDGPGPYTISIVSLPTHGTLSGNGNDRTYTPDAGYSGNDSFTWRVFDGLDYSNTATVNISVGDVIFSDDFNRADNSVVGNGWIEVESSSTTKILNQKLVFDAMDDSYRPLIRHSFANQQSGSFTWSYHFNFKRTGAEGIYSFWMQLGNSSLMSDNSPEENGVAVNLIWGGTAAGLDTHEGFGYSVNGNVTQLTTLSGGSPSITVTVNLDSNTYDISVNGEQATQIPFENNVSIDSVRFFANGLNQANFSLREIDNVSIISSDAGNPDTTAPAPPRNLRTR